MNITTSTISLNVDDVPASSTFLATHFGYRERVSADGFASLQRDQSNVEIVFLRRGISQLPEDFRHQHAAGIIVAFTVEDAASEEARMRQEGVTISMPLSEEPWGEKLFQVTDPNGIIFQLVEWVNPAN